MEVEIKLDSNYPQPKLLILTAAVTDEVRALAEKLSEGGPQVLSGIREGKVEVLDQTELIRVYAAAGKVFAVTPKGEYTLHLRLYELEPRLEPRSFVRISNSEIINLNQVDHFDMSFTGTICVKLTNGQVSYVSRRYVPKVKKLLGV